MESSNGNFHYRYETYCYKHVNLKVLVDPDTGKWLRPHLMYMQHMVDEGRPEKTMRAYGYRFGTLCDFVKAGISVLPDDGSLGRVLLNSYDDYLTNGALSDNKLVRSINVVRPSPMIAGESSAGYHSPISNFKRFNDSFLDQAAMHFGMELSPDEKFIFSMFSGLVATTEDRSWRENKKIREFSANSQGGGSRVNLFPHVRHKPFNSGDLLEESKYFPLEKIVELVRNATSYRDSALWSLIAATNSRPGEALQVVFEDIDFVEGEIFIVNPFTSPDWRNRYRGFSIAQYKKLGFKGRSTAETVLLEPYGSCFFDYLALYMEYERLNPHGYSTVFLSKDGQPLCFSDYKSTILEPFKRAAKLTLGDLSNDLIPAGLHSLRHSHIYFFRNFVRTDNGHGLTEDEMMLLTGHLDRRSLQKYGRLDRELLMEKISLALISRRHEGEKSGAKYFIEIMEARLEEFKRRNS
ncbi:site-specific integrase [Pseudomonas putida]|uniref:site-specific integrase n=1 Tax=Pseudomonas putida TaxID=303 RepID=UPI0009BE92EA|nr:site-specific integrase [Pseudomonas putida]